MKIRLFLVAICTLVLIACEPNESLPDPIPGFEIQYFDAVQGEWLPMEKPYAVKYDVEIRVLSYNPSAYNSFYPGDSILENRKWKFFTYSEEGGHDHLGYALDYDTKLNESTYLQTYKDKPGTNLGGKYLCTVVACNVGKSGDELKYVVSSDSIQVLPK